MADYSFVKDEDGNIRGLWICDASKAHDQIFLMALLMKHGHSASLMENGYKIQSNNVDDNGGCFILFN